MKRFRDLTEELFLEGSDMYPADDMTMKELKIACYAAQNILDRLESGALIQRWQISAIVKAKEELASVYTSMSAGEEGEDEDEYDDEWDMEDEEEPIYVGFEYPSMYGEATELDEAMYVKTTPGQLEKAADKVGATWDKEKNAYIKNGLQIGYTKLKSKPGEARSYDHFIHRKLKEETDYKVTVDGLPAMYVKADNPSEVKANLRKVVKNPEMIKGVERVAKATLQKIFRDKAAGKEEVTEGYNDPIHRKYISDTVHDYVAKDDPKHEKIVDHLHKAKNFGSKTIDSLSDHAGISLGAANAITKEVASNLKANFGSPQKTQTQAQRIGAYLKQKHIGPRSKS